jgi:hypothetical protein
MRFRIVYNTRFVPPRKTAWVLWPFVLFRHTREEVSDRLYRHELQHVYQIKRLGRLRFYWTYIWQARKYGYWNHPYEVEARKMETTPLTLQEIAWRDRGKIQL